MKSSYIILVCVALLLSGCRNETEIFSGKIHSIYYEGMTGGVQGVSRSENGRSGTSTSVNADVSIKVYKDWVEISTGEKKSKIIVPRNRVLEINTGTKEGNKLYPLESNQPTAE